VAEEKVPPEKKEINECGDGNNGGLISAPITAVKKSYVI